MRLDAFDHNPAYSNKKEKNLIYFYKQILIENYMIVMERLFADFAHSESEAPAGQTLLAAISQTSP